MSALQQETYPQIYPAREIIDSLAYPQPPIEPKKPKAVEANVPSKYPELSQNLKYSGISLLVFCTTAAIATQFYNPLVFVILMGSIICSIVFIYKSYNSFSQAKSYEERLNVYEKSVADYKIGLEQYNERYLKYQEDKTIYDKLVQSLKTPEDIHNYRLSRRLEYLRKVKSKDRLRGFFDVDGPKNPKLGRAEYFFKDYIYEAFRQNQISSDFEFHFDASIMLIGYTSHKGSYFYPDIMVVTPRGLLIDVEIDEPYIADTKSPIHCTHSLDKGDFNRNQYFMNHNCSVIRFSERQIIKYPETCLEIIRKFDDNGCLPSDMTLPDDFIEKSWYEKDALRMAAEDYRNSY